MSTFGQGRKKSKLQIKVKETDNKTGMPQEREGSTNK